MPNRRSLIATTIAAIVGSTRSTCVVADDQTAVPLYLHVYSNLRHSTYDQDRLDRAKSDPSTPGWIRVLTLLIVPNVPIFVRCPGGRDPDITVKGKVERREPGKLIGSLMVAWDDSYITEHHKIVGVLAFDEIHSASNIHSRYVFSRSEDPYIVLDALSSKDGG